MVIQDEYGENPTKCAVKDVQEAGNNLPKKVEYVIDRRLDHSIEEEKWIFQVWWYVFASTDDSWEPIESFSSQQVDEIFDEATKSRMAPREIVDKVVVL